MNSSRAPYDDSTLIDLVPLKAISALPPKADITRTSRAAVRLLSGSETEKQVKTDQGRLGHLGKPKDAAMLRDDQGNGGGRRRAPRNVLGAPIDVCSIKPMTGFYRDGCCNTGREDTGSHTVCVVITSAFLDFSKSHGNDLSTPVPQFGFPGLKPGDRWCLCAPRWQEAFEAGQAPRVALRATHEGALAHCSLADLKRVAVDID